MIIPELSTPFLAPDTLALCVHSRVAFNVRLTEDLYSPTPRYVLRVHSVLLLRLLYLSSRRYASLLCGHDR